MSYKRDSKIAYQKVEVTAFEELAITAGGVISFIRDIISLFLCQRGIGLPMFSEDAEALEERIYSYLLWDKISGPLRT